MPDPTQPDPSQNFNPDDIAQLNAVLRQRASQLGTTAPSQSNMLPGQEGWVSDPYTPTSPVVTTPPPPPPPQQVDPYGYAPGSGAADYTVAHRARYGYDPTTDFLSQTFGAPPVQPGTPNWFPSFDPNFFVPQTYNPSGNTLQERFGFPTADVANPAVEAITKQLGPLTSLPPTNNAGGYPGGIGGFPATQGGAPAYSQGVQDYIDAFKARYNYSPDASDLAAVFSPDQLQQTSSVPKNAPPYDQASLKSGVQQMLDLLSGNMEDVSPTDTKFGKAFDLLGYDPRFGTIGLGSQGAFTGISAQGQPTWDKTGSLNDRFAGPWAPSMFSGDNTDLIKSLQEGLTTLDKASPPPQPLPPQNTYIQQPALSAEDQYIQAHIARYGYAPDAAGLAAVGFGPSSGDTLTQQDRSASQYTPAQQAYRQAHLARYGYYPDAAGLAAAFAPGAAGEGGPPPASSGGDSNIPDYARPYHTGDVAHTPWLPGQVGWLSEGNYYYPDFGPNIPRQTFTSYPAQSPSGGSFPFGYGASGPAFGLAAYQGAPYLDNSGLPSYTPSDMQNPYYSGAGGIGNAGGGVGFDPWGGGPGITITPIGQ